MALVKLEKTLAPVYSPSDRPLRIAQIAPLYESVPPRLYGGTERIVAYLVEELARRGHQVTLFAAGDSTVNVPSRPEFQSRSDSVDSIISARCSIYRC